MGPELYPLSTFSLQYKTCKDGSVLGVTVTRIALLTHCQALTQACGYTEGMGRPFPGDPDPSPMEMSVVPTSRSESRAAPPKVCVLDCLVGVSVCSGSQNRRHRLGLKQQMLTSHSLEAEV